MAALSPPEVARTAPLVRLWRPANDDKAPPLPPIAGQRAVRIAGIVRANAQTLPRDAGFAL